jgi:tape measure domain-containing protein
MDGIEIPIGADFTAMQAAFDRVIAAVNTMGDKIVAALEKSSAAALRTNSAMTKLQSGTGTAAAAATRAGNATASASQKFMSAATTAGNLGHAAAGVSAGLQALNRASRLLAGVNLAQRFNTWITAGGGLRSALGALPGIMRSIATNRTFQIVAASAVTAYAAVVTIRTAFRIVSGAAGLLKNSALATFRGMVTAAKAAGSAIAGAFRGIASMPGKMLGSIPGLPIAGILSAAGAVALLATQLKGASGDAAAFEDMQVSVEHFTGSAKAAKDLLADLETFSIKTPFETKDVQMTAKGLLGAGIRNDVSGITKDLSAMAASGQELRDLGDALGKGFAKGKFQTEEMNKFLERGINLVPALNKSVGLTGDAFTKALEKGLSFAQVTTAIKSMSAAGGQFFGLLEKRSLTFNGLISTLLSAWTNLRKAFGQPINDALKPIIEAGIANLTSFMEKAKQLGEKVGNAISIVFTAFRDGKAMELFKAGLSVAFLGGIDILLRGFRSAVAFLATALPPIFEMLGAKLSDPTFWEGISLLFQGIAASFGAEIRKALGQNELAASLERQGSLQQKHGGMLISQAGNQDAGAVLTAAMDAGLQAAKTAAGGDRSASFQKALDDFAKITGKLEATVAADKIFADLLKPKTISGTATPPASPSETVSKAVAPAVMSLTRIGGGGFSNTVFTNLVAETKKQTGYLKKIAEKPTPTMTARYA